MKLKNLALPVALVFGALPVLSQAQLAKGDKEVGATLQYQSVDSIDITLLTGSVGQMFTDKLLGKFGLSMVDADGMKSTALAGEAQYLLGDGGADFIPYVLGGLAMYDSDAAEDIEFGFSIGAGLKQFVSERTAVNYEFRHTALPDFDIDGITIGINFYFD
ncbi:MAG: outer membrane beta-barrel protein [Alcanivoracaceae bacterium]|nr:outer membrane beta-barrel protein [Alcanivoracaceae bacterium]